MTRPAYAHELVASGTMPFSSAMIEGGVVGVVAKNIFEVSNLGFAAIYAAPMFANVTSLMWARASRGHRKTPFVVTLMAMLLVLVASVALLPTTGWGATALVGIVVSTRVLMAGMIAVRSTIWRQNYPRSARAQVTSRFVLVASVILAVWPAVVGPILDHNPVWFRYLYPATALLGSVGAMSFFRIRVRGERALLKHEREPHHDDAPRQPSGRPHNAVSVLRHDRFFRGYMFWQFLAGAANMTGSTAFALYVVNTLKDMPMENMQGMLINATLPLGLAVLSMPWWAHRMDALHIARYRILHGLTWIINQSINFVAATVGWLPLMYFAGTTHGLVRGGGILAWQLGHNDFADKRLVPLYMGIHQTLTGVRGAFAPFLGTLLLAGWEPFSLFGKEFRGWNGIGPNVFLITAGLSVVAWCGFVHLSIQMKKAGRDAAEDAG